MQVSIPQIMWHDNSARIMSVDFYPNSNLLAAASISSDDDTGIRVSLMNLFQDYMNLVVLGTGSREKQYSPAARSDV